MTYVARRSISRILLCLFLPALLLTLMTASSGVFHDQAPEGEPLNIKRYEHKLTHPVRAHSSIYKSVPTDRLTYHGVTPGRLPNPQALALCVSLLPVIYIILKRLLLHPLKYTSTFVDFHVRRTLLPLNYNLYILLILLREAFHEETFIREIPPASAQGTPHSLRHHRWLVGRYRTGALSDTA